MPLHFATTLTYPEPITPWNVAELRQVRVSHNPSPSPSPSPNPNPNPSPHLKVSRWTKGQYRHEERSVGHAVVLIRLSTC